MKPNDQIEQRNGICVTYTVIFYGLFIKSNPVFVRNIP